MQTKAMALIAILCLTAPKTLADEVPSLLFPVACALGETCFLQQFVDRDPGPGARAFDCGPQSYDGHTGTDIRVADLEAMDRGAVVIAAAPGTVRATRDGVPDGGSTTAPEGQGCGNGIVVVHQGGWETQYCHLMQGSLRVAEGDTVTLGQPLGLIGYSGITEFPHLEFLVRQDGDIVDPFDPSDLGTCGGDAASLWSAPVPVSGGGVMSAGFANSVPDFAAIQAGTADAETVDRTSDALVLWGFVHGARAGDQMVLRITDGTGTQIHADRVVLDRTQAQLFRASGRRTPAVGWDTGLYFGEVYLFRDDALLDSRIITVPVE